MLEAKAIWGLTCIAGGLFLLFTQSKKALHKEVLSDCRQNGHTH